MDKEIEVECQCHCHVKEINFYYENNDLDMPGQLFAEAPNVLGAKGLCGILN